jgi:hypothetical protein
MPSWSEEKFSADAENSGRDAARSPNNSEPTILCVQCGQRVPLKHIVFAGERFDVMSVRRWREKVLGSEKVASP